MRGRPGEREAEGMSVMIDVRHLHKEYRDTVAVGDVSFTVDEGEIFGILGPNGAGKTTTVECVEGLREPTGGEMMTAAIDGVRRRTPWACWHAAERLGRSHRAVPQPAAGGARRLISRRTSAPGKFLSAAGKTPAPGDAYYSPGRDTRRTATPS
jgi:ABC-2 type transport system ATP-binding protein